MAEYKSSITAGEVSISLARTGPQGAPGKDGGGLRLQFSFVPNPSDDNNHFSESGYSWDLATKTLDFNRSIDHDIAIITLNGVTMPQTYYTVNPTTIVFNDNITFVSGNDDEMQVVTSSEVNDTDGGGNASVTVSVTAPADPSIGDLWFNSDTDSLQLFVYDGTFWVQANSGGGGGSGNANVEVSETPPADPDEGDLWYESDKGVLYIRVGNAWIDASS